MTMTIWWICFADGDGFLWGFEEHKLKGGYADDRLKGIEGERRDIWGFSAIRVSYTHAVSQKRLTHR